MQPQPNGSHAEIVSGLRRVFEFSATDTPEQLSAAFRRNPGDTRTCGPQPPALLTAIGNGSEIRCGVAGSPTDQRRLQFGNGAGLNGETCNECLFREPLEPTAS